MKIDRYDLPISPWDHTATSDFGNWCRSADVARLEASHAELLAAAKAVVERWDSPLWKEQEHTGTFINRLRAAIAKAEGEGV